MICPEPPGRAGIAGATSQALDQEVLLHPVTKWVGVIHAIDDLGPIVRRAFREATSGRPGPVAVILSQDLLDGPPPGDTQDGDLHAAQFGRFPSTPVRPTDAGVSAIVDAIGRAERPLLVVGGGGNRSGVAPEAARLADSGVAVATTMSGRGIIDEQHSMAVGVLGSLGVPSAWTAAQEADLLIAAGTKLGSGTTSGYQIPLPHHRVAQIDIDPTELGRDRPVDIAIHADVLETLRQLTPRSTTVSGWRDRVAAIRAEWADRRARLSASDAMPIDPQRVMAELDRILRPTDVVVSDASLASGWVAGYLTVSADGPRTLFPRGPRRARLGDPRGARSDGSRGRTRGGRHGRRSCALCHRRAGLPRRSRPAGPGCCAQQFIIWMDPLVPANCL